MAPTFEQKVDTIATSPGAVLILAPDEIRKERVALRLFTSFLADADGSARQQLAVTKYDAAGWNTGDVRKLIDELQTGSLFVQRRCLWLKNADALNAAASDLLLTALDAVPPEILLVLSAAKLPKTAKLAKYFHTSGRVLELPELSAPQTQRWLQQELNSRGVSRFPAALLELISAHAQGSLDEAVNLIEMLALYAEGSSLSERDFFSLFVQVPNPGEYDLLDAIQDRRMADAELLLHQLLSTGKSQFLLVTLLFKSYFHSLLVRLLLDQGIGPDEIQNRLDVKKWVFPKYLRVARARNAEKLRADISSILRADSKLKLRSLGADCVLGELLQQLA